MSILNIIGLQDIQKLISGTSGNAVDRINGTYILSGTTTPQPQILSLVISETAQANTWDAYKPSPYFGILEVTYQNPATGNAQGRLHTWNKLDNGKYSSLTVFNDPIFSIPNWYISGTTTGYQDTYLSIVDNNAIAGNNVPVGNGLVVFNTDTKQIGVFDSTQNLWVWAGASQTASVPTGAIIEYREGAPMPNGYLRCDGTTVLKSQYVDLYAKIGDWYGAMPSGAPDFRLPNQLNRIIKA